MPGFDDEPRRGSAVVFNPHKATLVFCSNNLINCWLIWFLCVTANLKHEEDVLIVGVKSQKLSTYLESEGDKGHQVLHNVAGCVHPELVGHVPAVIIHPTPVLNLGKL